MDNLTHVINYGLPDDTAVYTHRSGRTGRAGKTGVSVAIIHSREKGKLREIEKKIGKKFERKEVPTPEHIIEKQLYNLADRIEKVKVDDEEIGKYMQGVSRKLSWLSQEDLLKRVLSLEFNRLLAYYRDAPSIDFIDERRVKRKKSTTSRVLKKKKTAVLRKKEWRGYMSAPVRTTVSMPAILLSCLTMQSKDGGLMWDVLTSCPAILCLMFPNQMPAGL